MDTEEGRVVESRGGQVVIELQGGMRCMTCAARGACQALAGGSRVLTLPVQEPVRPGQRVILRYPPRNRVLSALAVFLLPVVGLIGGYALASYLSHSEGLAVAGAFLGLVAGFVLLRLLDRTHARRGTVSLPEVVAVPAEPADRGNL